MKKKLLKFVFAVLFLFLPAISYGQLITIAITANVTGVSDFYNLLDGKVIANVSTITGTYTYNTSTADTNPSSQVGEYFYNNAQYGINWTIGELIFKTNPNVPMFMIGITNNQQGCDGYWVNSYSNSYLPNNVEVNSILWQLDDIGGTAISSTVLPITAPIISDWDYSTLSITGGIGTAPCYTKTFSIGANVVSAVLVPEPMSLLLFGFGLLALRRKNK